MAAQRHDEEDLRSHNFSMNRPRDSFESDEITAAGSDLELISLVDKEAFISSQTSLSERLTHASHQIASSLNIPTAVHVSKSIGHFLLPSFLRQRPSSSPAKVDTNSIAALDGLRGLACLFVFNEHLTYNFSDTFLYGYGYALKWTALQLPFVRIMWSGFSMVSIFFVISGYVLSYRPLRQIRNQDMPSLNKTLSSAVLRRALRLYLPTIIAVLICGLLVSLGAFNRASRIYNQGDNYLQLHESPPTILDGFISQMYDAAKSALQMLNFWDWTDDLHAGDYDQHLWTIVVEFRSSMVLFLLLLVTSRMKQAFRLITVLAFIFFCTLYARREMLLFTSGMLIAELDLIRKSPVQSLPPDLRPRRSLATMLSDSSLTWLVFFVIGLYLCSAPVIGCGETYGFRTLSSLVPPCFPDKSTFIRSIGAVFVTWPAANSDIIKPLFTNKFSIYLGKVSFALYLVHGNVLKTVLFSAMPTIYSITSPSGTREELSMVGATVSWIMGAVLVIPTMFWLADIFMRAVDLPCVKFARWVETKVCEEDEMASGRSSKVAS